MSLATKWRPSSWEDVVGQDSAVQILKRQINSKSFKNAYIFSGASGSGKTTSARIFANSVNNNTGAPIEIDAASNNGVDNIRNISAGAKTRSLDSEYKIYIIDEAHMLTTQAWNALLKLIEEPPKYTIFIFCTTDPQKIPDTIKNRCMRLTFNRIHSSQIATRLNLICKEEGFNNYIEACSYISRVCNGEMRNAISLLETCVDYSEDLSLENVLSAIGNFSYDVYFNLVNAIIDGDILAALEVISNLYNSGADLKNFTDTFLEFLMDCLKYIFTSNLEMTKIPQTFEDKTKFATGIADASKYFTYFLDTVLELKNTLKYDTDQKTTIECVIVRMCRLV